MNIFTNKRFPSLPKIKVWAHNIFMLILSETFLKEVLPIYLNQSRALKKFRKL